MWLILVEGYTQQIQFEHINTNDGLSQNSVVSIDQDSSGFMWFATQDGLNKYDGSNFKQYEIFFRDITEKTYHELGKIKIDSKGRIWMTMLDGGLQYCDPVNEKFTRIEGVKDASFITEIKMASGSEYWVSSYTDGLFKLKQDQGIFKVENEIPDLSISKILPFDNQLLLISKMGLLLFDPSGSNEMQLFDELENVSDVEIVSEDQLLVATLGKGLYLSDKLRSFTLLSELPKGLLIQDVFIDTKDRIWVGSYGDGVYLIEDGNVSHFILNSFDESSINYNDVLSIFQDKEGNIWFGTDGGGLSYIVENRKPIYNITNNNAPEGVPVDVPRAISKDADGNLWIGTSGKGLSVLSADRKRSDHFDTDSNDGNQLTSNRVMSLLFDLDQNMWIGTQGGGLMVKRNGSKNIEVVNAGFPSKTIWDIAEVDKNHLWVCSRNEGVILLNKKDKSWRKIKVQLEDEVVSSGNVRVIVKGSMESFFIGTENGELFQIDKEKVLRKLSIKNKNTGAIKSLLHDGNHLWVGTQQAGILIYNLETNEQIQLGKSSGLPNNVIYSILPQDEKFLWVSTNKGICQINKSRALNEATNIVNQHLRVESGLVSNEFNTGAAYQDDAGKMYFGGIDGVNWFHPDEVVKDTSTVDLILLDLIITNRDGQELRHIHNKSSIDLKHHVKNFQIKYVAQTFAKTPTKFHYKLEGINTEWVNNESNELISFSNIPPGDYNLLISTTNGDGVRSKKPIEFGINIIPAFWQTLLFKLLLAIGLISLLWYLYHLRVRELKRTSALKEQMSKVEAKALKLQMNPHFLFNSLNAIDNYILNNEKIKASEYLSKFSKLIRQILDYSEQNNITLGQELETLGLYIKMEKLRFQNRFDYELNVSDAVNLNEVRLPPLILQPFVENAIWHGLLHLDDVGKLKIEILNSENGVQCIIDDNGIGRASAMKIKTKSATSHKSHGIRITEKRLSLNNELNKIGANVLIEDKVDDRGKATGTRVTINLHTD